MASLPTFAVCFLPKGRSDRIECLWRGNAEQMAVLHGRLREVLEAGRKADVTVTVGPSPVDGTILEVNPRELALWYVELRD